MRSFVYLPDLPKSSERFRETELSRRIGRQKTQGLWRRIEFLRPWVAAVYEQVTEQVDELAWGTYGGGDDEAWFLVARINQPGRHVLQRLHKRTLPRIAEEVPGIEIARRRFRGRRIYEWRRDEIPGGRRMVSYALVGRLLVMGSDETYVRGAIEQRPVWWQVGGWGRRAEAAMAGADAIETFFAGYRPGDDAHFWFHTTAERVVPANERASRLQRFADRLRQIIASRLSVVSVDLRITPPTITGRWQLDFARTPKERVAEKGTVDFAALVPESTQTFIAVHRLPLDHPLFGELRTLLAEAISSEALEPVRGAFAILRWLPGVRDVPEMIRSLERQLAYCSFAADGGKTRRCLMVALENADVVESGMRAVPGFLRRLVEKTDYRGRPVLRIPIPIPDATTTAGAVLSVAGQSLVITTRADAVHRLVDGIENGKTLGDVTMVKRSRSLADGAVLAEFYTAGKRPAGDAPGETAAPDTRAGGFIRSLLGDRRVVELAEGRSYSICVEHPRGVGVVTCSATGFHWSFATAGLAAALLRTPSLNRLIRSDTKELGGDNQTP